jgi:hypothetical protein
MQNLSNARFNGIFFLTRTPEMPFTFRVFQLKLCTHFLTLAFVIHYLHISSFYEYIWSPRNGWSKFIIMKVLIMKYSSVLLILVPLSITNTLLGSL